MLVGLQGSGKTTTAAKLGLHLRRSGQAHCWWPPIPGDRRPLSSWLSWASSSIFPVYAEDQKALPTEICSHAVERAREPAATWVIVDTQGRLHIDEALDERAPGCEEGASAH